LTKYPDLATIENKTMKLNNLLIITYLLKKVTAVPQGGLRPRYFKKDTDFI